MRQQLSILIVAAPILLFGCVGPDDLGEGTAPESVEVQSSPLTVKCQAIFSPGECVEYTKELLTIRIKSCLRVAFASGPHTVSCAGEPGFVTVGGGVTRDFHAAVDVGEFRCMPGHVVSIHLLFVSPFGIAGAVCRIEQGWARSRNIAR